MLPRVSRIPTYRFFGGGAKMQWKDEYSLGIAEIDAQHRELLSLFGRISQGIVAGASWSDLHYRVSELRQFADFHFAFEEGLMRMFGFPGVQEHTSAHRALFSKLDDMERRSVTSNVERELLQFLVTWLIQHIQADDRDYSRHIFSGATLVRSQPTSPAGAKLGD